MAHPRSICDSHLPDLRGVHPLFLSNALLEIEDNVLFVDVFRAYMAGRTALPREMRAEFYRQLATYPDSQWVRLLRVRATEEGEEDALFFKLEGKSLEDMVDPITLELPVVPVGTVHGRIYEDAGLREWLTEHDTDPCTREFLREYDKKPLEIVAEWILLKEPASADEGEKKAKWCEKRADYLFRAGRLQEAATDFKHVPSMTSATERIFAMLEYGDDPDLDHKSGTSERILLLAAEAGVEKAYMCLGMLEMNKVRPDFDLGGAYFEQAETFVNSINVGMLLFDAMYRCKEFERAVRVAEGMMVNKPHEDTKGAFQFMADCALYGKHGVPLDHALARSLLRDLEEGDYLDDMQVKYAHMLLKGLGGDQDVVEGMLLLRNCLSCAGEAQDLFMQVAHVLSSVECVRERHDEYMEGRNAKRVRRPAAPIVIE